MSRAGIEGTCTVSVGQHADVQRPFLLRKRGEVTGAESSHWCRGSLGGRRITLPLLEATAVGQIAR